MAFCRSLKFCDMSEGRDSPMWPFGGTKALPSALHKAAISVGCTNLHPQAFWKEKEIRLTEPLQNSKHCKYLVQAQCCMTDPKPESAFLPRACRKG